MTSAEKWHFYVSCARPATGVVSKRLSARRSRPDLAAPAQPRGRARPLAEITQRGTMGALIAMTIYW